MVSYKILVGAYSSVITTLKFDSTSSSLPTIATSYAGQNPSWIAAHPTNKSVIFATQENYAGAVWSFAVNSQGQLTQLGSVSTGGDGPAFMLASSNGNEIVAANYNGGNALNVPLTADKGHFGSAYPLVKFTGSGPNQNRQTSPHPHQVIEYGSEYLVPDLGSDKVWRLTKTSSGALQNSGYIQQPSGSGPRHGVVKGNTLYTLHELSNTLTQQTIPALGSSNSPPVTASVSIVPSDSTNPSALGAGELLLSPSTSDFPTQYLYATNRGEWNDAITIVSIANNGLQVAKQVRTGLQHLRGAVLSPDGAYLVVGGMNSGGVVVYQRINGGADLKEVARAYGLNQPTSFVWL
ncbi:lactonase, 7-bladed beta-propeller [Ceratobasidium sp. AG-Ba]|nr:lactonase, 7-bladed beta-propeller [Ceratobasidium sp. AG-Ba]